MSTIKRTRFKETKRWSKEETVRLLEILMICGADKIEKPSKQLFYRQICDPILARFNWVEMRDKTKNLRTKYKQAIDWLNNTRSGLDVEGKENSIREYTLKICPEFDLLDDLYANKANLSIPFVCDSGLSVSASTSQITSSPETEYIVTHDPEVEGKYAGTNESEFQEQNDQQLQEQYDESTPVRKKPKIKTIQSFKGNNSSIQYLVEEKTAYLKEHLLLEKEKHENEMRMAGEKLQLEKKKMDDEATFKQKELDFEREKLNFQINKINEENRLREIEINKNSELKQMELQMNFKLRKYELSLKYGKVVNEDEEV